MISANHVCRLDNKTTAKFHIFMMKNSRLKFQNLQNVVRNPLCRTQSQNVPKNNLRNEKRVTQNLLRKIKIFRSPNKI